jgi:tetratricopeptide (TPR) repeat protein
MAVQLKPNNADALYLLGQGLLRSGDHAGAIVQWRKAIEVRPDYSEALYNLSRVLAKSDPEEAKRLQNQFEKLQAQEHITDRAQTLGNFALASAAAHDWPQAIAQLKEGIKVCGDCDALPLLKKDIGLIYCRSGDLKAGRAELLEAQKLNTQDPEIEQALRFLENADLRLKSEHFRQWPSPEVSFRYGDAYPRHTYFFASLGQVRPLPFNDPPIRSERRELASFRTPITVTGVVSSSIR